MHFKKNSLFAKALFSSVTLLTLFAAPALAEDASGKFTLTKEVHWGSMILAPGDYTYKLERQTFQMVFVRAADGAPGFLVMAKMVSTAAPGQADRLVLKRQGDEWFVSSMVISGLDEELSFAPPREHAATANTSTQAKLASLSKP